MLSGIMMINAVIALIIILFLTAVRLLDSSSFERLAEEYEKYSRFDTNVSLVLGE